MDVAGFLDGFLGGNACRIVTAAIQNNICMMCLGDFWEFLRGMPGTKNEFTALSSDGLIEIGESMVEPPA